MKNELDTTDSEKGRAGNFHDHLFVQVPGEDEPRGPLCDACAESLSQEFNTEIIYK